jgi:hypothetical protein
MPKKRTIIQLVPIRNALLALTDASEIWILYGLDSLGSGTDAQTFQWHQLTIALPDAPDVVDAPPA